MTSKSSFWGSLKENGKRRLWVWVLSILAFMLVLPLVLAMRISLVYQQTEWLVESYGVAAADRIVHNNLLDMVKGILGPSFLLMAYTLVFAVANAVQGFSWLYSRKKIDFYMGMPVKRSRRFLVIWLNGIFIYVIPYLLGLVICMLIAAGNHGLDAGVAKIILQALLLHLILYLCIYHMSMLAVMLTGNLVITGMGIMVFFLYEWLVRRVDYVYRSRFFRYFSMSDYSMRLLFSPVFMYSETVNDAAAMFSQAKLLLPMVVFAAVTGAISYICYLKRPAESAGKAMVFSVTKPVVKILLVVPMALLMGDMISNEVNYAPEQGFDGGGYVILALALVIILGSAVIQVLYEFDIKGALHQKKHIIISGVLVALIFMAYRYDLLNYDGYVPDPEKVDSIAFLPEQYETVDYRSVCLDADGKDTGSFEYADRYMYLKNTGDVCGLARYSMEKYDEMFPKGEETAYTYDETEEGNYWSSARILYRMKNGKEVVRRIWVDVNDEETGEYLDRIIGSSEFKEGYLMGASDRLIQLIENDSKYQINAYYGNLVYEQKMRRSEILELLECYREDMEKFNFTRAKESTPAGVVRIEFSRQMPNNGYARGTATNELGINIYPFFDRSIACLKKLGYYMDCQIDVEDVDRIYVTNQNSDVYQELQELQRTEAGAETILENIPEDEEVYGIYDIDTRGYADYTDREDIEKIAGCIYSDEMLNWRWDGGATYDYDYRAVVYFKADSNMSRTYGTYADYVFKKGEIPGFVQEDTTFRIDK